jgi:hypothetical protein
MKHVKICYVYRVLMRQREPGIHQSKQQKTTRISYEILH